MRCIPIIIPTYEPGEEFPSLIKNIIESLSQPVIIVDDGSDDCYREIFNQCSVLNSVVVLRHAVNLGKGRAIKTAFNYVLTSLKSVEGVVLADSDGQHDVKDIRRVLDTLKKNPKNLVLGCRSLKYSDAPWKSKFGNNVTRGVLKYICGVSVSDTQTGLRGIPVDYLKTLMQTPGERFEYETNMLLECNNNNGIQISEVPITTIYDSKAHHKTHFDPLSDSITIYKVILAYSLSSVLATVIDFTIFSFMTWMGCGIWISTGGARIAAAFSNFLLNRNIVFKSKGNAAKQLVKYAFLVLVSGLISAFAISNLIRVLPLDIIVVKVIVESCLFFFNYYIQRTYIFVKRKNEDIERSIFSDEVTENTDWTSYYQDGRGFISRLTQKFTLKRIIDAIKKYVVKQKEGFGICELGGGNSCFCKQICEHEKIKKYDIVDNNPLAVKLFNKLEMNAGTHTGICRNLLSDEDSDRGSLYDFVFSIGLIEHFRGDDIQTMIRRHFDYCKDGGIVLISFPTPTGKYLFFRKWMELLGVWQFHDEKPILYDEVADFFAAHGEVLAHSINRELPLTQEIVIVRKGGGTQCQ